jgi:hypothetical protein
MPPAVRDCRSGSEKLSGTDGTEAPNGEGTGGKVAEEAMNTAAQRHQIAPAPYLASCRRPLSSGPVTITFKGMRQEDACAYQAHQC